VFALERDADFDPRLAIPLVAQIQRNQLAGWPDHGLLAGRLRFLDRGHHTLGVGLEGSHLAHDPFVLAGREQGRDALVSVDRTLPLTGVQQPPPQEQRQIGGGLFLAGLDQFRRLRLDVGDRLLGAGSALGDRTDPFDHQQEPGRLSGVPCGSWGPLHDLE